MSMGLKALLENCNFHDEKNKVLIAYELGRLDEKESKITRHITHNCKTNDHKNCYGKSNAWGKCECWCHK